MATLRPRRADPDVAGHQRLYKRLGLGSALIYLAFLAPGIYSLDGNSMLAVAESVVLRHSLAVSPTLGAPGPHGHFYSVWYPLLSALAVPFVAIGSVAANLLHMPVHYCAAMAALVLQALIAGAAVSAVAALAIRLGASTQGAKLAALAFGFGTIFPTYSRTFFAEPLLALVTAYGAYLALGDAPLGTSGISALAVLAKPTGVVVGAASSAYSFLQNKARKPAQWLLPAAGTVLGLLIYLGYDYLRFRRFSIFADHPASEFGLAFVPRNLAVLFFSPSYGLLWFCPVIIAGFAGLYVVYRRRPWASAMLAAIFLGYLLVYSLFGQGQGAGDWSWGPRYVLPAMAVLLPCVGLLQGRWRKATIALAAVGFLVSAPTWICLYERAFAENLQRGVGPSAWVWTVKDSTLLRVWPAALHQLEAAARTNPRVLISEAERPHSPARTIASSRALRIVAVWWWLLPAVKVPRWIGAVFSLALVLAGIFLLRSSTPPPSSRTG